MIEDNLKTEEYIVAFIDMLGSKELMREDQAGMLKKVHNVYRESIDILNTIYGKADSEINVRIFSDNILVFCRCGKIKDFSALNIVVSLSAIIQVNFLRRNILVRGGIAKGDFFADDIMVWGTALVKAYNLENSIAVYPRILIDSDIISDIIPYTSKDKKVNRFKEKYISQDNDRLSFVNYVAAMDYLKDPLVMKLAFKSWAGDQISKYVHNIKAVQKWLWHSRFMDDCMFGKDSEFQTDEKKNENLKECET